MHDSNKDLLPAGKAPSMLKLLREYLKPYTRILIFALALNGFHGFAVSYQTLIPKYFIDEVLLAKGISEAVRFQRLALLIASYLFAVIVCRMLVWHWSYRIFTRIRERVILALRAEFFRHINRLCLRFHGQYNSGELFSYVFGSPLTQLQQYFQQLAIFGPGAVCTLALTLFWVFRWDWLMTVTLAGSVAIHVLLTHYAKEGLRKLNKDYQSVESSVSGRIADLIRGKREIKLYAMEGSVIEQFEQQANLICEKAAQRDIEGHVHLMKPETSSYIFFALLCIVGYIRYQSGVLKVGQVQAYLASFTTLQWCLNMLMQIALMRGGAQASLERIFSILSTTSTTPDPSPSEIQEAPKRGDLELCDLRFAYDQHPILCGINLCIPYGQRVAIVGPSGSGKSTLAQLLLRLYAPNSGCIRIGGCDIKNLRGSDLRRLFGIVPQDPYFFQTTLRDNLRTGSPDATDDDIRAACEKASAWEFVAKMPDGLETRVGESGATLSGGQRQRLAIARALLSDPPFFLFDEATSALDNLSERLIQQSLDRCLAGRTALFIAHRLSTVRTCDRILVLKNGEIVQDGSYQELVSRPGLFKEMVESDELKS